MSESEEKLAFRQKLKSIFNWKRDANFGRLKIVILIYNSLLFFHKIDEDQDGQITILEFKDAMY